jgi:HD superfamily phosphohydrolase
MSGAPTKVWRYRDEIHGDVLLDPVAVALINTAPLQRLGRVYQLGYTHLVYRGATHTRLSHVIGAYHMAGRFVDYLRENYRLMAARPPGSADPEEFLPGGSEAVDPSALETRWLVLRYLVQWAALLHDVGHVPLGHTLEDEFEGIYVPHDKFESPRLPVLWGAGEGETSDLRSAIQSAHVHGLFPPEFKALGVDVDTAYAAVMTTCLYKEKRETVGSRETHQSFPQLLDQALKSTDENALSTKQRQFVQFVQRQFQRAAGLFHPYMADIVSDTICADYMDYVRRDTANTGLDRQTDDRVLSQFLVGRYEPVDDGEVQYRMALLLSDSRGKPRLDACTGVVDLVRRRFRLAEIIYYHKTKVSASAMLAKAFSLVGTPDEVSAIPEAQIGLKDSAELAQKLVSGEQDLHELRHRQSANSLLSPDIGDESLLIWLQQSAWDRVAEVAATTSISPLQRVETITAILRGVGLLQLLVRRKLYKAFAQINSDAIAYITGIRGVDGDASPEQTKRRVGDVLKLRGKANGEHERRARIERAMAEAAEWPVDSLLVYVPPRKSQAKGIETRALSGGAVVTLGEHPAVSEEVKSLNRQYERLWRVILLVHPQFEHDALGLSSAIDTFIREVWSINPSDCEAHIHAVARFVYIPQAQREGAKLFRDLCAPGPVPWSTYLDAASSAHSESTLTGKEQAYRGYILSIPGVSRERRKKALIDEFPDPEALQVRVREGTKSQGEDVDQVRLFLSDLTKSLHRIEDVPTLSAKAEKEQELSATAFESRARAILRQYMPAAEGRSLRPSFRDFISRNKLRSGRARHRLIQSLGRFDLSDMQGMQTQFNRDHSDQDTDRRLVEIEQQALGDEPIE